MILMKADARSEAGELPDEKLIADMMKFNEELVKHGIMLAGEGLHPTAKGARVRFSGGQTSVRQGPFGAEKDLVAGFWIWKVASLEEAIAWVRKIPSPTQGGDGEVEIRPIFEAEDFGKEFSPELRRQEEQLRAQVEAQLSSHH
jgi:hypothetical protein